MTNKQIWEKIIEKAVKNGFYKEHFFQYKSMANRNIEYTNKDFAKRLANDFSGKYCRLIIFSHDFARALFKDKWKACLQEMVLQEEPLKFLETWK